MSSNKNRMLENRNNQKEKLLEFKNLTNWNKIIGVIENKKENLSERKWKPPEHENGRENKVLALT